MGSKLSKEQKFLKRLLQPFPREGDYVRFKHGKAIWQIWYIHFDREFARLRRPVKSRDGILWKEKHKTLHRLDLNPEWKGMEIVEEA